MKKISVCVIFGGASSEHEVSCVSASSVLSHLSPDRYDIHKIGITKEGRWLYVKSSNEDVKSGAWAADPAAIPCAILPDATLGNIALFGDTTSFLSVDVVFPVLHGKNGEDGTIQGLFELAKIPYVGCGVFASAASMDKGYTKIVVDTIGVQQAKYLTIRLHEYKADPAPFIEKAESDLLYPIFVKPASAGSSVGISKATDRESLISAIDLAFEHDRKVILEECIVGRELETAVLGNTDIEVSCVGEVLAADEFYSYDAKYNNAESVTLIPTTLPEGKEEELRDAARRIFAALDGRGLSRVDFFLRKSDNAVIFNEINTLPGFTSISMYPKLFGAVGVDYDTLVDRLIELALAEHA